MNRVCERTMHICIHCCSWCYFVMVRLLLHEQFNPIILVSHMNFSHVRLTLTNLLSLHMYVTLTSFNAIMRFLCANRRTLICEHIKVYYLFLGWVFTIDVEIDDSKLSTRVGALNKDLWFINISWSRCKSIILEWLCEYESRDSKWGQVNFPPWKTIRINVRGRLLIVYVQILLM